MENSEHVDNDFQFCRADSFGGDSIESGSFHVSAQTSPAYLNCRRRERTVHIRAPTPDSLVFERVGNMTYSINKTHENLRGMDKLLNDPKMRLCGEGVESDDDIVQKMKSNVHRSDMLRRTNSLKCKKLLFENGAFHESTTLPQGVSRDYMLLQDSSKLNNAFVTSVDGLRSQHDLLRGHLEGANDISSLAALTGSLRDLVDSQRRWENVPQLVPESLSSTPRTIVSTPRISSELSYALKDGATPYVEAERRRPVHHHQQDHKEVELNNLKHKLEQTEHLKDDLLLRANDMSNQIVIASEDKSSAVSLADNYIEQLHSEKRAREAQYRENSRLLEQEIQELRKGLQDTNGFFHAKIRTFQEALENSEGQRLHLLDLLQGVKGDLDMKDDTLESVGKKSQQLEQRLKEYDRYRIKVTTKTKQNAKQLEKQTAKCEHLEDVAKDLHRLLKDGERKRSEVKTKAQGTVARWKAKCEDLLEENRRQRDRVLDMEMRCSDGGHGASGQRKATVNMEAVARELNHVLQGRAEQEEVLRNKTDQLEEYRNKEAELMAKNRGLQDMVDSLETDVKLFKDKLHKANEDIMEKEEELVGNRLQTKCDSEELERLRKTILNLGNDAEDLTTKLSEEKASKCGIKEELVSMAMKEKVHISDLTELRASLKEKERLHDLTVSKFRDEIAQLIDSQETSLKELVLKLRKDRAELEAEVRTLHTDLEDSRNEMKNLRHQVDEEHSTKKSFKKDLEAKENEIVRMSHRLFSVTSHLERKTLVTDEVTGKIAKAEHDIESLKERLHKKEGDIATITSNIGSDIESIVDLVNLRSQNQFGNYIIQSTSGDRITVWIQDNRSKLHWIKSAIQECWRRRQVFNSDLGRVEARYDNIAELNKHIFDPYVQEAPFPIDRTGGDVSQKYMATPLLRDSDYDFSNAQSHEFCREPSAEFVINVFINALVAVDPEVEGNVISETVNNEINLSDCEVYSYNPDLESDPYGEEGSLWSLNYFFYNQKLKRILFLTCRASHNSMDGLTQEGFIAEQMELVVDKVDCSEDFMTGANRPPEFVQG